ncbi:MAG TPA: DegT/DnrJ/EryC1/StrS family aminotransferase [Streptosporangiaceae bacterium]
MSGQLPRVRDFPTWPQFGDEERSALLRALDQGQWWRMGGSEVDNFEREFALYHGGAAALAVTNGTHALELGLELLGVGPGTEVIVPAFTFISSALAAQRLGAVAVPVDIDPGTYCIDPAAVTAAISPRTRAIMPVHMAGQIADMDVLPKIAADAGVDIIQDAAHAHGARWRGQRVGELGSIAAFSFQNGKLMTAGEGGALVFGAQEQYEEAFLRHSCGRPRTDTSYLHKTTGSNYRMNEFSASVLRAQLARLDGQIDVREKRFELLFDLIDAIPGVEPQVNDPRCDRNPHYMMMFRVPGIGETGRNALVKALISDGLPAFVAFRAVYRTESFWRGGAPDLTPDELAARCPVAETVANETIWLHHRVLLGTDEQMHEVAAVIAACLRKS